jgi:diguanylate cyclase (GGDEF)-like protein/PAS domain S-box-containing protein
MTLWNRMFSSMRPAMVFIRIAYIFRQLHASLTGSSNRLIDHLLDGILVIDQHSRIVEINHAACRILALKMQQVIGKPVMAVAADWQPIIRQVLATPSQRPASEFTVAEHVYELYAAPNPGGRLLVIRDMTSRRQIEQDARQDHDLAEERANRLEIIKNLAEILNQTLPPERALKAGLEMVARQVGAQAGWLLTLTPENKAVLSAGYEIPSHLDLARHSDHHWPLCACLREEQAGRLNDPIRVFDCERLSRTKDLSQVLPKHHLSIPVRASGKPVGILNLIVPAERQFDASEMRMLALYGDQFGGAVERVRLFAEVHKMAITDPLTELYNRRHFFDLAEREIERVRRYGHPLSVAMLDVDFFKKINDTYGHQAGDEVLRAVARISCEEIRRIDILARYGGEEMIILMPETSHERAVLAMERLRKAIEVMEIATLRGTINTTVSIGMACKGADENTSLNTLIEQADQALYTAKQAGRNRVCSWEARPA